MKEQLDEEGKEEDNNNDWTGLNFAISQWAKEDSRKWTQWVAESARCSNDQPGPNFMALRTA